MGRGTTLKHYRKEIRQVIVSVNMIDGIYDILSKNRKIKQNMLALLYAIDDGKLHSQTEICEQWLIPRTTINTIVKECINDGYITFDTSRHTKEKIICITDKGKEYAQSILKQIYEIEYRAMEKTLSKYSVEFVQAMKEFADNLKFEIDHYTDGEQKMNDTAVNL